MEESTKNVGIVTESHKSVCGVCEDKAKSFHFGGISCDSCKAFFRRAVQNNGYKKFLCNYTNNCTINMSTRKSCQKCRFEKCVSIGMEIKWVMSDEERILHNLTRSRVSSGMDTDNRQRQKQNRLTEEEEERIDLSLAPNEQDMLKYMSFEEKAEIESIAMKFQDSYVKIQYKVSELNGTRGPVEVVKMFTTIIRRFALFCKGIDDFSRLSKNDQQSLLRAGVLEMCLLRGAFVFDMDNNQWPSSNIDSLKDCPRLRLEDMEKLVSSELYDMHKRFITSIQKLKADEPTVMLLLLVVLFYPDRAEVEDYIGINQSQEKFITLLQKYIQWRYGHANGSKLFPRLLSKLSDLRQLNDSHTAYNLKLDQEDLHAIQNQLGQMNLNPCPQWDEHVNKGMSPAQLPQNQRDWTTSADATWNSFSHLQHRGDVQENLGFFSSQTQTQTQNENAGGQSQSLGNPAQGYFQQMITEKIPTLIQNPFAPISFETDMLQARALFQNASNKPEMWKMNMEIMQKAAAMTNLKDLSFPMQLDAQNGQFQDFQPQPTPIIPSDFIPQLPLSHYSSNPQPQLPTPTTFTFQHPQEMKEMAGSLALGPEINELEKNVDNSLIFGNAFPQGLDISKFLATNYSNVYANGEVSSQQFPSHTCHRQVSDLSEAELNIFKQRDNGMNNYENFIQSNSNSFDNL